jgi:hypothetical protein
VESKHSNKNLTSFYKEKKINKTRTCGKIERGRRCKMSIP